MKNNALFRIISENLLIDDKLFQMITSYMKNCFLLTTSDLKDLQIYAQPGITRVRSELLLNDGIYMHMITYNNKQNISITFEIINIDLNSV